MREMVVPIQRQFCINSASLGLQGLLNIVTMTEQKIGINSLTAESALNVTIISNRFGFVPRILPGDYTQCYIFVTSVIFRQMCVT